MFIPVDFLSGFVIGATATVIFSMLLLRVCLQSIIARLDVLARKHDDGRDDSADWWKRNGMPPGDD
jgi:hypothetical protein